MKSRAKRLNAQIQLKRQEERRRKFEREADMLETKFTAHLPELFKEEFEVKYLTGRFQNAGWKKRFLTSWRAVQKMLIEIQLDPIDWCDNAFLFYDFLAKRRLSYSYVKKILLVANLWGHFLSRKLGQLFMRIPSPRGVEKARLLDAYFEKAFSPSTNRRGLKNLDTLNLFETMFSKSVR